MFHVLLALGIMLLWFLSGITGVHIGLMIDDVYYAEKPHPADMWFVLFGPLILIVAIWYAVEVATGRQ